MTALREQLPVAVRHAGRARRYGRRVPKRNPAGPRDRTGYWQYIGGCMSYSRQFIAGQFTAAEQTCAALHELGESLGKHNTEGPLRHTDVHDPAGDRQAGAGTAAHHGQRTAPSLRARLVASVAVLASAAGLLTTFCGWPYFQGQAWWAVINVVNSAALVAGSALLVLSATTRRCGVLLGLAGLCFPASWLARWNTGLFPLIGVFGSSFFFLSLASGDSAISRPPSLTEESGAAVARSVCFGRGRRPTGDVRDLEARVEWVCAWGRVADHDTKSLSVRRFCDGYRVV